MSETNFNSSARQPDKKKIPLFYWVIVAVLLIGCIYLFVSKDQAISGKNAELKNETALKDSVEKERNLLEGEYQAANAKIDQLMSDKIKNDSALTSQRKVLDDLKNKIQVAMNKEHITLQELKKAHEMIKDLSDKVKGYEERIAALEKENQVLTGQNAELKTAVDSVGKQNTTLKKYGSVLNTNNIRLVPEHKSKDGKETEVKRKKASKTNTMKIIFDIVENHIAESGNKKIYIRLIGPDNNVLTDTASGSGNLTSAKGEQVSYTVVKEIALTKGTPLSDVTVEYSQKDHFKAGSYNIEIYSEGVMVGSGTVKLKSGVFGIF
jgi:hypothetical protein